MNLDDHPNHPDHLTTWSSDHLTEWTKQASYCIPDIFHFFGTSKILENKIYTEKSRKLRQNTQKIANFLRYYGKIHSKLPIFRVKSVKFYTGQKKFTRVYPWDPWQIWGMGVHISAQKHTAQKNLKITFHS